MSQLSRIFNYSDQPIRTIVVDDEPWFVIADLARVLELSNPTMVANRLDADALSTAEVIDGMGRGQTARITNEAGMYELIFMSRKAEARDFRRWITREVIPALRTTGSYSLAVHAEQQHTLPQSFAQALQLAADQARQLEAQADQLAIAGPKAEAWDTFVSASGDHSVGEVAKMLARAGVDTGRDRLFDTLYEWGWIFRYGEFGAWEPIQLYVTKGWLRLKARTRQSDRGRVKAASQVRITGAGAEKILAKLTAPVQLSLIAD